MQTKSKASARATETLAERIRNGKHEAILRAAAKVFAQSGYFNAKVSDVARSAGVADGTVYLYFKNKDDLLTSIFAWAMGEFLTRARLVLARYSNRKGISPSSFKLSSVSQPNSCSSFPGLTWPNICRCFVKSSKMDSVLAPSVNNSIRK
jgi:AcrR family transcriptional regulator